MFTGSPKADWLTTEALTLGQALGTGPGQLAEVFLSRGLYLDSVGRGPEALGYLREAARLAEQAGDHVVLANVLVDLSATLVPTDPAGATETARNAAAHARRVGDRDSLAYAIGNLAEALVILGDWDAAEGELTHAANSDGLADYEYLTRFRAWLAALRGDSKTAETMLAALPDLRASENPQDKAANSNVEAFTAAARHRPKDALRHARVSLAQAVALGPSFHRWAWPLAARAAHDLRDTAATGELLALLDGYPPGHVPPMLRAERDLARARLAACDGDPGATKRFDAAISCLRANSTPYHLAHGLLDHAEFLSRLGDTDAADAAIAEAGDIAERLRCQPLLDRAATVMPARSPVQA